MFNTKFNVLQCLVKPISHKKTLKTQYRKKVSFKDLILYSKMLHIKGKTLKCLVRQLEVINAETV